MPLGGRLTSIAGGFLSVAFILSGIVYLLVKLLYEYDRKFLGYSLIFLAAWSIISWVRTFFFMPIKLMPKKLQPEYDLRRNSAISHIRNSLAPGTSAFVDAVKSIETKHEKSDVKKSIKIMFAQLWPLLKTLRFLSLSFWFSVGLFRVVTFLGWFDSALDFWLPRDYEAHSDALNYLGIATGCSVFAGLIPGFIINFSGNRSESKGLGQSPGRRMAIFYLSIFLALLGALELFLSAQRKKIGATVTSFFFFQSYRSMLTGVASQSCFLLFPVEMFGILWGVMVAIAGCVAFLAEPFLNIIMNDLVGNFELVLYAFSALSILTIFYPIVLFMDRNEPSSSRRASISEQPKMKEDF